MKEQPGSASVVQGVENELGGIGYSGIGYKTSGVRAVPLADKGGPIEPTQAAVETSVPDRALPLRLHQRPGHRARPAHPRVHPLRALEAGQEDTVKDGYFPLPESAAGPARKAAGIK